MNKFYTILVCSVLAACAGTGNTQTHFVAQQKGEKQMARLLFDEQFPDQNIASRGWDRQPNQINATTLVHDDTLNKNVIYHSWTNRKRGLPDGAGHGGETFGRSISTTDWNNGVTFYTAIRFHNFIYNGSGGNCHAPLRASVTGYLGNAPGEFSLDPTRYMRWNRMYPDEPRDQNRYAPEGRIWMAQFDGATPGGHDSNWGGYQQMQSLGSYLEDDVWYEFVMYLDTNRGQRGGESRAWYRVYGETNWNLVWDFRASSNYIILPGDPSNPYVGLGPYLHDNYSSDQARVYTGWLTVWSGDAMADGDIGGGTGPGPDPEPEPDDPLAISNHKVKVSDTSATLTWDTNKPSNTVVDFGPTEARGTIVRGNNNTTEHVVELADLTPNTAYYYRYSSRTADGETVMDEANSTFMTKETDNGGTEPEPVEGSLNDLTDVALDNPVEGQVLMYRDGKWVNIDAKPLVAQLVEDILNETSLVVNKPSA